MVPWYHPGTNCTRSLLGSFVKTLTPWLHPRSPEAELSGVKEKVKVAQSCPALCNPMDCSPPGSSVHRILQARILEWVAVPFSRGSSQPKDQTQVSGTAGRFFTIWATREAHCQG